MLMLISLVDIEQSTIMVPESHSDNIISNLNSFHSFSLDLDNFGKLIVGKFNEAEGLLYRSKNNGRLMVQPHQSESDFPREISAKWVQNPSERNCFRSGVARP